MQKANAVDALLQRSGAALCDAGFLAKSGKTVDALIVAAPKQHNTVEEKRAIKYTKAKGGCGATGRSRHFRLRLQQPSLDRPPTWADPQMDGARPEEVLDLANTASEVFAK